MDMRGEKKMRKIILVVICCMLVCTGCNRQVELTEEEAFKGVDDIITDQQINIHFALKERPLLGLSIESPWGESMIPSMTYSPFNKKLGVKIRAEGKEWMIEDLYRKDQKVVYKSGNELPTQGGEVKESVKSIYENAEWKLKPSKDVYHIWIDQYIENTEAIIEPVELFRLIDQTSGTEFIVSLTDIDMIIILCGIIYILTLSMGCSTNQNDAEERLKQERFQGVEEVATDQQINMYFAYKDIEMKEYNSFQFRMNFTSDTYPDSGLSQSFSSKNGKVGIRVKTSGNNQWEMGNLYFEPNKTVYQSTENTNGYSEEESLLNELFKTAAWKLHPLREDYRIWLDDCVRVGNKKAKSESDPIELFELIDQTTGTTFTVSIRVVFDDERLT